MTYFHQLFRTIDGVLASAGRGCVGFDLVIVVKVVKALNSHWSSKNNQAVAIVPWFCRCLSLCRHFTFLAFAKVSVSVSKKIGLKKVSVSVSKTFGLEKKSRYQSRKHLVSKKSLGIGLKNIWSRKKVSVSVSKIFGLEKKSRYRSRKLWSQKKSRYRSRKLWSQKKSQ